MGVVQTVAYSCNTDTHLCQFRDQVATAAIVPGMRSVGALAAAGAKRLHLLKGSTTAHVMPRAAYTNTVEEKGRRRQIQAVHKANVYTCNALFNRVIAKRYTKAKQASIDTCSSSQRLQPCAESMCKAQQHK